MKHALLSGSATGEATHITLMDMEFEGLGTNFAAHFLGVLSDITVQRGGGVKFHVLAAQHIAPLQHRGLF